MLPRVTHAICKGSLTISRDPRHQVREIPGETRVAPQGSRSPMCPGQTSRHGALRTSICPCLSDVPPCGGGDLLMRKQCGHRSRLALVTTTVIFVRAKRHLLHPRTLRATGRRFWQRLIAKT